MNENQNQVTPTVSAEANSAKSLGIVSVVFAFFVPLVSWICGGIGLGKAKRVYKETQDPVAKKAKSLCTAGIVIASVLTGLVLIISVSTASVATKAVVDSVDEAFSSEVDAEKGVIGDYVVKVTGSKVSKTTYDNKDVVVVTYEFTNNSDSSQNFAYSIDDKAYQDGAECEHEVLGISEVSGYKDVKDNDTVNVKPGKTIEVRKAYVLNDKTTDVELEIGELVSFSDDVLEYTIPLK